MNKSKNCPFCDSEPKVYIGPDHLWRVICSNVWACGAKTVGFSQKIDAINAWDTRSNKAEPENHDRLVEENKRLREALTGITNYYCDLINSGDCGNWNPEEDEPVISARLALSELEENK